MSDDQREAKAFQKLATTVNQQEDILQKSISTLENDLSRHDQNIREHDEQLRAAVDGLKNLNEQVARVDDAVDRIERSAQNNERVVDSKIEDEPSFRDVLAGGASFRNWIN